MTTAVLAEMDARHSWFGEMEAEHRSWIGIVARAGIDLFVDWLADEGEEPVSPIRALRCRSPLGDAPDLPQADRRAGPYDRRGRRADRGPDASR